MRVITQSILLEANVSQKEIVSQGCEQSNFEIFLQIAWKDYTHICFCMKKLEGGFCKICINLI